MKKHFREMNQILLVTALAFFTIISCSPSGQDRVRNEPVQAVSQNQDQPATANTVAEKPVAQEATKQASQDAQPPEGMLNPPHGEPFHRCDIPVGAPLNSKPATTTRQINNSSAVKQTTGSAPSLANNPTAPTLENARRMNPQQARTTAQQNNNTGPKPKLNPPHGQPWHRCDIAVGSPLP